MLQLRNEHALLLMYSLQKPNIIYVQLINIYNDIDFLNRSDHIIAEPINNQKFITDLWRIDIPKEQFKVFKHRDMLCIYSENFDFFSKDNFEIVFLSLLNSLGIRILWSSDSQVVAYFNYAKSLLCGEDSLFLKGFYIDLQLPKHAIII